MPTSDQEPILRRPAAAVVTGGRQPRPERGVSGKRGPRFAPAVKKPAAYTYSNPFQNAGFALLVCFLFLAYSRILDFVLVRLHLPLITSGLAFLVTVFTGGVQRAIFSRIGALMMAFTVWLIITIPFAFWRGGSIAVLQDGWSKSLLLFIAVAGLARTLRQCRQMMFAIAAATLAIVAMSFIIHDADQFGRLELASGLLNNSNDLAQILLIGLPFWFLMAITEAGIPFRRFVAWMASVAVIGTLGKTGSRSGMIGLAVLTLVIFLKVSLGNKLKMIVPLGLLAVIAFVALPRQVLQRYSTIFGEDEGTVQVDASQMSALASSEQRKALFRQSIKMTLANPIFGVGPGNFQAAVPAMFQPGEAAFWRETHSTYTQVSSETGLPGLALFCAMMIACWQCASWLKKTAGQKPELADISKMAFCLQLSLLSLFVTSAFSSIAYGIYFPTLAGLSAACFRCGREELTARGFLPQSPG